MKGPGWLVLSGEQGGSAGVRSEGAGARSGQALATEGRWLLLWGKLQPGWVSQGPSDHGAGNRRPTQRQGDDWEGLAVNQARNGGEGSGSRVLPRPWI